MNKKRLLIIIIILLFVSSQKQYRLKIKVVDDFNIPIEKALIYHDENLITSTDLNGVAYINKIDTYDYNIIVKKSNYTTNQFYLNTVWNTDIKLQLNQLKYDFENEKQIIGKITLNKKDLSKKKIILKSQGPKKVLITGDKGEFATTILGNNVDYFYINKSENQINLYSETKNSDKEYIDFTNFIEKEIVIPKTLLNELISFSIIYQNDFASYDIQIDLSDFEGDFKIIFNSTNELIFKKYDIFFKFIYSKESDSYMRGYKMVFPFNNFEFENNLEKSNKNFDLFWENIKDSNKYYFTIDFKQKNNLFKKIIFYNNSNKPIYVVNTNQNNFYIKQNILKNSYFIEVELYNEQENFYDIFLNEGSLFHKSILDLDYKYFLVNN